MLSKKTWAPKPIPETYVLTEAVTEVAESTRRRCWRRGRQRPAAAAAQRSRHSQQVAGHHLELGKFVREYRDKGFALREIRPMLIKAFGPRILKVVQEPRPYRGKDKAAAAEAAASTASTSKKTAAKKTATKTAATTTASKKTSRAS